MKENEHDNKEKDLTVYPVKIDEDQLNVVNKYPLLPIPFFLVVLGRVKAGKSTLLNSLTLSPRFYGDDFQVKILISPTLEDPAMKHIKDHFDFVFSEYSEALLEEILDMVENDENPNRYLLVLDDAITSNFRQSKSGKIDAFSSLITRYRHTTNQKSGKEGMLSIILTLQYFKYLTPITRTMAMGLIICGELSDQELKKISEAYDFFGGNSKKFLELYRKCRIEPYDFCFLNVDSMEMRRNFNEVVWSKSDQKKIEHEDPPLSPQKK
jgi:GTPase SAR1 family protein